MLEEAMAQLKLEFADLSANVDAERTSLRAQIYKAQEDAGALVRTSVCCCVYALEVLRADLGVVSCWTLFLCPCLALCRYLSLVLTTPHACEIEGGRQAVT